MFYHVKIIRNAQNVLQMNQHMHGCIWSCTDKPFQRCWVVTNDL